MRGGTTTLDLSMVPYSTTTTEEEEVEDEAGEVDTKVPMEKNQRFIVEPTVEPVRIPATTTTTTIKESKVVVGGVIRYKECMRNHAASIGGHANDGCGEFMPPPLGGLKCVACGCHRNFHRREIQGVGGGGGGCVDHHRHRLHSLFPNLNFPAAAKTTAPIAPMPSAAVPAAAAPPSMLIYNSMVGPNQRWEKRKIGGLGFRGGVGGYSSLSALSLQQHFHHHHHSRNVINGSENGGIMFTSVDLRNHMNRDERHSNEDRRSETPEAGRGDHLSHQKHYHRHHHHHHRSGNTTTSSSSGNKRFRTKFSMEQKEKMVEFAEKIGWRLKKEDDVALSEFCLEVGVKRHVLRVWMHNNKNTLRIRNRLSPPPPGPPPPLRHHSHDDALPHHLDPHAPPPPTSSTPPPLAPPILGV